MADEFVEVVLVDDDGAVTSTTESRGNPVAAAGRNTLPGIAASVVFEVENNGKRGGEARLALSGSA